ncbi:MULTISPECIES: helix-turn-helix domain-containing protein [unclassified Streptomyces]|jgi:DNA-binding HxlR family transcriptional regulator|uniref:winged helix-turn-helix transcriptional regulator n=1 Tax=unclassified Streptomyces TaxID=2593676 RepID=UPI000F4D916D|nr:MULTISPECIES: helix-turn-helix domain-containing protein [unclassified Streptomyces]MDH6452025.1 DNA-binding HxlR family transcriptional regulator [Streptomyces sp. SAI-119]MDH6497422.1 DNA-binding HxlR family transcriptional regulator [Streptomyces sp. SAI-149]QUC55870.1 helix-turn-helix transcriptional regulator [Streptomyces sp. A2-16]
MPTMTAAQRREQAREEYDAFIKGCPTNQLLDRLSDKWVSLVVAALSTGPMRYSDLSRKIAGVSPKMLTQTLRALERDGILSRTVTPSVPVRVDYDLTPLGRSLAGLLTAVKTWAETHIEEVHEARERYDTNSG